MIRLMQADLAVGRVIYLILESKHVGGCCRQAYNSAGKMEIKESHIARGWDRGSWFNSWAVRRKYFCELKGSVDPGLYKVSTVVASSSSLSHHE